jgi:7-cyano-7-deazaguanine synthase
VNNVKKERKMKEKSLSPSTSSKALVMLSGGLDSTTCLGVARKNFKEVEAIGFDYGQRHSIELESAKALCEKYNIPLKIIKLSFFGDVVQSALMDKGADINKAKDRVQSESVSSAFVPNRNTLFLTITHAYAQTIKAGTIYTGVCQMDEAGFPDCRNSFIESMQTTLNLGAETAIKIVTPLMWLSKGETFMLAEENDCLRDVLDISHTCYEGNHTLKNEWGYGCGECPSCKVRKEGYEEYLKMKETTIA